MNWRNTATKVITTVLAANPGAEPAELRALISAAYPFGPRRHHPYKIWLSEVRRQLEPKVYKGPCACGHGLGTHRGRCHAADCRCEKYSQGNPKQPGLQEAAL